MTKRSGGKDQSGTLKLNRSQKNCDAFASRSAKMTCGFLLFFLSKKKKNESKLMSQSMSKTLSLICLSAHRVFLPVVSVVFVCLFVLVCVYLYVVSVSVCRMAVVGLLSHCLSCLLSVFSVSLPIACLSSVFSVSFDCRMAVLCRLCLFAYRMAVVCFLCLFACRMAVVCYNKKRLKISILMPALLTLAGKSYSSIKRRLH